MPGIKIRFKKPPIVERIIGVYYEMSQEHFDSKLPGWVDLIKKEYPIADHIAEWFIDIQEKDGVPLLMNPVPQAKIIHLYWKYSSKGHKVFAMRVRPDRLVFHLTREDDNPHRFEELFPELEKWINPWAEHFNVPSIDGVTVEYVNLLNRKVTPTLVKPDGALQLTSALEIFSNIPGRFKGIVQPYDCKARLVVDEKMPCFFDVKVRGDEENYGVRVDFAVTTRLGSKSITPAEGLKQIQFGHDVMLEQFDCFFTPHAKQSFEPYEISG